MLFRLVIPLLLISVSTAFARIGEKVAELDSRHGHHVFIVGSVPDVYCQVRYAIAGFLVNVQFSMGVSKIEHFSRPDNAPLSDDEIKEILKLSAEKGQTWKKLQSKPGSPDWKRSDSGAEAFLADDRKFLFIKDPKWSII